MPIIRPTVSPVVRPVVGPISAGALPWDPSQGGATPLPVVGIKTWSATAYYAGAADGEPKLTETFTSALLVRFDAVPAGSQIITGHGPVAGAAGGHNQWSNGAAMSFSVVDGGGLVKTAPTRTIVAGDVNKCTLVVGTYDGAAVRQYFAGSIVGTSTACVGLGAQDTDVKTAIGIGINGSGTPVTAATNHVVIGWAVSTTAVLDAAGVAALYAACKVAAGMASFTGMTHRWQASANTALGATWTDDTGGVGLSKVGTTMVAETFTPSWI